MGDRVRSTSRGSRISWILSSVPPFIQNLYLFNPLENSLLSRALSRLCGGSVHVSTCVYFITSVVGRTDYREPKVEVQVQLLHYCCGGDGYYWMVERNK